TLIVDDEFLARERLRNLLATDDRFLVVSEAADGNAALEAIQEYKPQLVFLDVQMPERTGIELLAHLQETGPTEQLPTVIFVTAYDEFALNAFDLHAVDYLLKPFDRSRFQVAIEKALSKIQQANPDDLSQRLAALI